MLGHSPTDPLKTSEPAEKPAHPQQSSNQIGALKALSAAHSIALDALTQHSKPYPRSMKFEVSRVCDIETETQAEFRKVFPTEPASVPLLHKADVKY